MVIWTGRREKCASPNKSKADHAVYFIFHLQEQSISSSNFILTMWSPTSFMNIHFSRTFFFAKCLYTFFSFLKIWGCLKIFSLSFNINLVFKMHLLFLLDIYLNTCLKWLFVSDVFQILYIVYMYKHVQISFIVHSNFLHFNQENIWLE